MTRHLLSLVMLVGLVRDAGGGQDFVPVSPSQSGVAYTTSINDRLHGGSPIDPRLVCYHYAHLPADVIPGKLIRCHGCARTTPCTAGTEQLLAIGTPGGWSCNSGHQPDRLGVADPITNDVVVGALTTVKAAALSYPDTRVVRIDATATVQAGDACSLGLYLNGSGTPSRTAQVSPPPGGTITTQVVLTYESAAPVSGGISAVLKASTAGACTILRATGQGAGATMLSLSADRM